MSNFSRIPLLPGSYNRHFETALTVAPESYLSDHLGRPCHVTLSGRHSLEIIFEQLCLSLDDEIYVTTTFNSSYVSGCVSSTIFKYCKPSRVLSEKTKAIIVIHEFGVPYHSIKQLIDLAHSRGIPIIEDCAHAMGAVIEGKEIGTLGDFAIFSLPKLFPLKYGGLLVGDKGSTPLSPLKATRINQIKTSLGELISLQDKYAQVRKQNYQYLTSLFTAIGQKPLFEVTNEIVPYVFPLVTEKFEEVVEGASSTVESYIWHGNNIVILPVHQFLSLVELDYIFETVQRSQEV